MRLSNSAPSVLHFLTALPKSYLPETVRSKKRELISQAPVAMTERMRAGEWERERVTENEGASESVRTLRGGFDMLKGFYCQKDAACVYKHVT